MLQKKDKRKIIFFKESMFKIAELIFNFPNKTFHVREFSKKTNFSTTAVTSAITELNKYKIVNVKKTNITTNIKANLESEAYYFYKKIFNLYKFERYPFLLNEIKEKLKPKAIVVFGSFAKGEDVEESDIDLLVISNNKAKIELKKDYEEEFKRKINLHVLASLEKSSNEFKNAIANGIVLDGYIKVI